MLHVQQSFGLSSAGDRLERDDDRERGREETKDGRVQKGRKERHNASAKQQLHIEQ